MYCEILSPDSIIAGHLLVYATAFLAPVVILCDTKLACVRGRPDSLLFLIPGEERFRSKASTTISVGSEFSSENQNLSLNFCRAMSIEDDARASRFFVWKIGSSDNKNAFLRVCSLCDCFHWQEDRWRDFVLPNVLKGSYVKRRGCRLWQFSD